MPNICKICIYMHYAYNPGPTHYYIPILPKKLSCKYYIYADDTIIFIGAQTNYELKILTLKMTKKLSSCIAVIIIIIYI